MRLRLGLVRPAMLALLLGFGAVRAEAACEPTVGEFVSVDGAVEVRRGAATSWERAVLGASLCQLDTVRAGRHSRAALALVNGAIVRVDQSTTLRLLEIATQPAERSIMELLRGALKSFSRKPRLITVNAPYLNGTIEGTEFLVRASEGQTDLTVLEGRVRAENARGSIVVAAGEVGVARPGFAPELRTLVRPRDAAVWTLYYPPVLTLSGSGAWSPQAARAAPPDLREAIAAASGGDLVAAIARLDAAPAAQRDARHHLYRAALLLAVGQAGEARESVERALGEDPAAGLAYALRAVIHVVQLRREEALADARRAVEIDPSPAARIALSYAEQSAFRVEEARGTMEAATAAHPDDALAWARLAELRLMVGDREGATQAASRATALAPEVARTQLVLGYAALARFRNVQAREAFERAIVLASADPLAHLGLGLTRISDGALEAGRRQLEIAVGLDANSALLRAYLGKAYFEERRGPLDAEQFAIAKELDPNDPTAFLYDAIAKQTTNRPVEALRSLEESIARNDGRAVYRGRLLLDSDRAARGTSQARIFDDLGFERLGINTSSESLTLDPTSASAHRFLSDSYRAQPRREIARVSELLQAQMLQDVNLNPVQPSVSSTSLGIVSSGGPTVPGFNEFTPLFEQDRLQLNATGFLGSNDTWGAEAVVSGVFDNVSLSGGGFAFDTDGFRENADLRHHIANAYTQVALTPAVNVQGELAYRDSSNGDIFMNFDADDFDPTLRQDSTEQVGRLGVRLQPSSRSTVLVSAIFANRDFSSSRVTEITPSGPLLGGAIAESSAGGDDSQQYEGLYAFRGDRFNLVAGGAYARVDIDEAIVSRTDATVDPPPVTTRNCLQLPPTIPPTIIPIPGGGPCPPGFADLGVTVTDPPPFDFTSTTTLDASSLVNDYRAYGYVNVEVGPALTLTGGLSYTDFEDRFGEFSQWNQKAGVQWDITDGLRLRSAYVRVVKPALASNRLLEPTQVAGFNQFFDDGNGTRSTRYGVALDWRVLPGLYAGGELSRREIDHRNIDLNNARAEFQYREEQTHRAYLYWTPSERWALSAGAVYDKFENSVPSANVPDKVITRSFPFTARYFHPSGLFLEGTAAYVRQDVRRPASSTLAQGDSSFGVLGLAAGYRLPKRLGIVSVSVDNLLDRNMDFQDDSYRSFDREPTGTPYVPERTVMGRVSLNWR